MTEPIHAVSPFAAEKVRYWRGKLRERLSYAKPREIVETVWLLDRLRSQTSKSVRPGYDPAFSQAAASIGDAAYIGGWELETILIEYLSTTASYSDGKSLNLRSWKVWADLVNWLRAAENEQSKIRGPSLIFEELTRIGYRQFGYQADAPEMFSANRWWAVISSDRLKAHLEAIYDIDFKRLLRTLLVTFVYFDDDPFRLPPPAVDYRITTEIAVARVLTRLSQTVPNLRGPEPASLARDEIAYRESPLRKTPIICFEHSGTHRSYSVPLRNLLWWRVTGGLYYDLVDLPQFQNEVGAAFERYFAEFVAAASGWTIAPRRTYQLQGFGPTECPDCVACDSDSRVRAVVECKAIKATLAAQTQLLSAGGVERAIAELSKGVVQVLKYHQHLTQTGQEVADPCVLMVVTLDDWIFFGDALRQRVYERAVDLAARHQLPTQLIEERKILLISSADVEYVMAYYSMEDFVRSFTAATGEYYGHDFRSIPKGLGCEVQQRKAFMKTMFDELVGIEELNLPE